MREISIFQRLVLQAAPVKIIFPKTKINFNHFTVSHGDIKFFLDWASTTKNHFYSQKLLKAFIEQEEAKPDLDEKRLDFVECAYEIMAHLLLLQATPETEASLIEKSFVIPSSDNNSQIIKIWEDVASISQGTTGLATWSASLHLIFDIK